MSQYLFYLDGNLIDEPIGWNESERKLVRSKKWKGLFLEYINNLTFHGTGYDYLINVIDTDGFCSDIYIEIQYRCSEFEPYKSYFTGLIKLEDAEVDVDKCQIKATIEDNSLSGLLDSLSDVEVPLDATLTLQNTALAAIDDILSFFPTNGTGSHANRTGFRVYDTFQFILDYITNSQINFESTLLQTPKAQGSRHVGGIFFSNAAVELVNTHPTANLTIVYKNAFNEQFTLVIPKQTTVAETLNYAVSQFNFNSTGNHEEKFYTQDYRYISQATHNSTNTITLQVDIPGFSVVSVSGATASISTFSTPVFGFKDLSITNGNYLRGANTIAPQVSFEKLFRELDKFLNLGMSITTVYGVTTLRIEQIGYFYDIQQSISIENVPNIMFKQSEEHINSNISLGDGESDNDLPGFQTAKDTWLSDTDCTVRKLDLTSDFIADSASIDKQRYNADDSEDDNIYIVECQSNDSNPRFHVNRIYYNTTGSYVTYNAYNPSLTNYYKLINWFFNINGNPRKEDRVITNTETQTIRRLYEFSYELSVSQQLDILSEREKFIKFNPETNLSKQKSGWIEEISFNNKTGICKFKLITE